MSGIVDGYLQPHSLVFCRPVEEGYLQHFHAYYLLESGIDIFADTISQRPFV